MVVDASVVVSRLVLLPEVAGAVARRTGDPRLARRAVDAVLRLPALRLVQVDDSRARRPGSPGADAVYIAGRGRTQAPAGDLGQRTARSRRATRRGSVPRGGRVTIPAFGAPRQGSNVAVPYAKGAFAHGTATRCLIT